MKTNARLLALARKYHELKAVHKFALCQAASANQNKCFNEMTKLLIETANDIDAKHLKRYIERRTH